MCKYFPYSNWKTSRLWTKSLFRPERRDRNFFWPSALHKGWKRFRAWLAFRRMWNVWIMLPAAPRSLHQQTCRTPDCWRECCRGFLYAQQFTLWMDTRTKATSYFLRTVIKSDCCTKWRQLYIIKLFRRVKKTHLLTVNTAFSRRGQSPEFQRNLLPLCLRSVTKTSQPPAIIHYVVEIVNSPVATRADSHTRRSHACEGPRVCCRLNQELVRGQETCPECVMGCEDGRRVSVSWFPVSPLMKERRNRRRLLCIHISNICSAAPSASFYRTRRSSPKTKRRPSSGSLCIQIGLELETFWSSWSVL